MRYICSQAQLVPTLSQRQRAEAIADLRAARNKDLENLTDSGVSPAEAADLLSRAAAAGRADMELKDGFEVSREDIAEALEVPPPEFSPQQRSSLVMRLKRADQADRQLMNILPDDDVGWSTLREQADRASQAAEDLESGKDVPWFEIKQALQVPENP